MNGVELAAPPFINGFRLLTVSDRTRYIEPAIGCASDRFRQRNCTIEVHPPERRREKNVTEF